MNFTEIKRSWGAIKIKHPMLTIFTTNRKTAIFLAVLVTFCVSYVSAEVFGVVEAGARIENDFLRGLLAFVLQAFIVLIFASSILFVKTTSSTENERIDKNARVRSGKPASEIDEALTLAINSDCEFRFEKNRFFDMPRLLESSYRWAEFDREEFFLVKAGALDKPKLALRSLEMVDGVCRFELGVSSFYDIFFTTYSPDLHFSSQSASESGTDSANTVRGVLGKSLDSYYSNGVQLTEAEPFKLFDMVPNPLGVSGIVTIQSEGERWVLLRERGSNEVAAQRQIEWSFAGLLEASDFLHTQRISMDQMIDVEFLDEVVQQSPLIASLDFDKWLLGMTLNPLYLYQPEIYVLLDSTEISRDQLDTLRNQIRLTNQRLEPLSTLGDFFDEKDRQGLLKNLCQPGLRLLKQARPEWFESAE